MALKDKQKMNRTIVLNITEEEYSEFMHDSHRARQMIDTAYTAHPELFPSAMSAGYKLNGTTRRSRKLGIKMRRICTGGISYQIRPGYVLPHMRGGTDAVEKALFLVRFGVPFWALTFVFGRNAMYWYRLFVSLSSFSVVGTRIHKKERLPVHLLADEYHIRIKGVVRYVATTISCGCIPGVEAVKSACSDALEKGYAIFKEEAHILNPQYKPRTVNIDGWQATQKAWRQLFKSIFIIECFLHAYIKVRDRATKTLKESFHWTQSGRRIGKLDFSHCPPL